MSILERSLHQDTATNLLHDTLLRADREAILQLVLREIDLWDGLLVLDLLDRLFDLSLCRRHECAVSCVAWRMRATAEVVVVVRKDCSRALG